jgi:hypothetical protein
MKRRAVRNLVVFCLLFAPVVGVTGAGAATGAGAGAGVAGVEEKKPVSGAEFCERLAPFAHLEDRRSLKHVREALGLAPGDLGESALQAAEKLKGVEFVDLIAEDPEWKDRSTIEDEDVPIGAIFVLDRSQTARCPVAERSGHVAVKCEPDVLVWFSKKEKAMTISRLARDYPKCIRAIMYNPNWDDETEDKPDLKENSARKASKTDARKGRGRKTRPPSAAPVKPEGKAPVR